MVLISKSLTMTFQQSHEIELESLIWLEKSSS